MNFHLPGGSLFGGGSPAPLPPPPPVPTRDDPAVVAARKKLRQSELQRKGRRASILAPREDQLGAVPVTRPEATGKLGG